MKVFISYAREDIETARKLYHDLKRAGITPWMDKEDILIGENWKIAIRQAIKESSYFIALLSSNSLSKQGYVQKELKMALNILAEMPVSGIFFCRSVLMTVIRLMKNCRILTGAICFRLMTKDFRIFCGFCLGRMLPIFQIFSKRKKMFLRKKRRKFSL